MSTEQVLPWYSGATTFLKSPQASFDDIKPGMVAIGGAPHDSTHGHRAGARYGPRGIREGSQVLADKLRPAGDDGLIHVGSGNRLRLPAENMLVDVGDYNSYPTDMDRAVEGMAGGVYEVVKRGGFSVCLGGDHFVGYPSCLGFTRAVAEINPNVRVGYIHIDGHLDFTDVTPLFGRYSNGTNARRISEIEVVSPKNMVWIGIDGYVNAEQADTIKRNGATVFTGLDVQEMGPVEVARRAAEACDRRLRLHLPEHGHRRSGLGIFARHRLARVRGDHAHDGVANVMGAVEVPDRVDGLLRDIPRPGPDRSLQHAGPPVHPGDHRAEGVRRRRPVRRNHDCQ